MRSLRLVLLVHSWFAMRRETVADKAARAEYRRRHSKSEGEVGWPGADAHGAASGDYMDGEGWRSGSVGCRGERAGVFRRYLRARWNLTAQLRGKWSLDTGEALLSETTANKPQSTLEGTVLYPDGRSDRYDETTLTEDTP